MSFKTKLIKLYHKYCGEYSRYYYGISQRTINKYSSLVKEICNFFATPPCYRCYYCYQGKIKFAQYYKRRDINRIFSEIGNLKIIRYTTEYGRTIVHFEATFD